MKGKVLACCALAVGGLAPHLARGAITEIAWGPAGTFAYSSAVAAGKFVELCGKLTKGQQIDWRFTADRPLDFNIHYHVGKLVEYPEKRPAIAAHGARFKVPLDQDYCWMWQNKTDHSATIDVQLRCHAGD